jgi:hypothetical protein
MRAPSRTAVLMRLIWVICEPMWKCSSDSWPFRPAPCELADDREDLVGGQAELRALAARALPAAAAAAVQLGAHADLGLGDPVLLVEDVEVAADLAGALQHDDHVVPELRRVEGHAHELAVLVAVADQQRLLERRLGQRQQQLRLAAGLEPVVQALARLDHRVDHAAPLVDLQRVHADVLALVVVVGDRLGEGALERLHLASRSSSGSGPRTACGSLAGPARPTARAGRPADSPAR